MAGKGLKRLLFLVVFLIPVGWYLFLQLFGDNKFSMEMMSEVPNDCGSFTEISVLYTSDSLDAGQVNYLNRVTYQTDAKKIPLLMDQESFFLCTKTQNDLMLVNEEGIWGVYDLSREGVDKLLTELDILVVQKSYGKGVGR